MGDSALCIAAIICTAIVGSNTNTSQNDLSIAYVSSGQMYVDRQCISPVPGSVVILR